MVRTFGNEDLDREFFLSQVFVGGCPKCGSRNTHDCDVEAYHYTPPMTDKQNEKVVVMAGEVSKIGSSCPLATKLDDPTLGHCDDCNHLWCLICGGELTVDSPICGHYQICGECSKSEGLSSLCPYYHEAMECPDILAWIDDKQK